MPDIEGIVHDINSVFELIFGKSSPSWLPPLVGWILLGVLLLYGLRGIIAVFSSIITSLKPLFYNPEQKRQRRRRQSFAKHVEYEILRLDLLEDWKDDRFAELEAEVEAEGRRKNWSFIPFN